MAEQSQYKQGGFMNSELPAGKLEAYRCCVNNKFKCKMIFKLESERITAMFGKLHHVKVACRDMHQNKITQHIDKETKEQREQ